ncbi:MAG: AAA family ATPase [Clostridia bacterium]|nr:AAA family ATPase [Clostridia bacterium]
MHNFLTGDQLNANIKIRKWFLKETRQVYVLTGYAGTGKTTLLKHVVLNTLKLKPNETVAFVTPTGKAATVLIKSGVEACTLHHLIYQSSLEDVELNFNGKTVKTQKLIFKRRKSIDKNIKLIVLDEASMVSDDVIFDILKFGVKVLLCGDNAQLPPVEGVNTFLKTPDYCLTNIVRQQSDNPIISIAQRAREGLPIDYGNYGDKVFVLDKRTFYGERRKQLLMKAQQIICGTNKTRAAINEEMREYLGRGALPESGEKLICTQNNWETFVDEDMRFNLVNGIIGEAFDPVYDEVNGLGFMQFKADFLNDFCPEVIPFDLGIFTRGEYNFKHGEYFEKFDKNGEAVGAFTPNRFEYGYCISCHKAQGSEFETAIVFDESFAFREDKNRWLYTAITRAKNKLIIIK